MVRVGAVTAAGVKGSLRQPSAALDPGSRGSGNATRCATPPETVTERHMLRFPTPPASPAACSSTPTPGPSNLGPPFGEGRPHRRNRASSGSPVLLVVTYGQAEGCRAVVRPATRTSVGPKSRSADGPEGLSAGRTG